MLLASLITVPCILGSLLVARGIIGCTIERRRTFCRSCRYEIGASITVCSECGSQIARSSREIAFALNHPRLAALVATASPGRHKVSTSSIAIGAAFLFIAAGLIGATLHTKAHRHTWRAMAPSTFLIQGIENAPSLADARASIDELDRRVAKGALSPLVQARFEAAVQQLARARQASPVAQIAASPRSSFPPPHATQPTRRTYFNSVRTSPTSTSTSAANQQRPVFAAPAPKPQIRVVESWALHSGVRTRVMGDEYRFAEPGGPAVQRVNPEAIERFRQQLRELGMQPETVLKPHNFEIRVPTFQPPGTVAPLYTGLATPKALQPASAPAKRPQRAATKQDSLAPKRITPKRL